MRKKRTKTIFIVMAILACVTFSEKSYAFDHVNLFWVYSGTSPEGYLSLDEITIQIKHQKNIDALYKFKKPDDLKVVGSNITCANNDCRPSPPVLKDGTYIYKDQKLDELEVKIASRLMKYPVTKKTSLKNRIKTIIGDKGTANTCSSAMQRIIEKDLHAGLLKDIKPSQWENYVLCFTRAISHSKPISLEINGSLKVTDRKQKSQTIEANVIIGNLGK